MKLHQFQLVLVHLFGLFTQTHTHTDSHILFLLLGPSQCLIYWECLLACWLKLERQKVCWCQVELHLDIFQNIFPRLSRKEFYSSIDQPTFTSISHNIQKIFICLNHIVSLSCSVLYIPPCSDAFFCTCIINKFSLIVF